MDDGTVTIRGQVYARHKRWIYRISQAWMIPNYVCPECGRPFLEIWRAHQCRMRHAGQAMDKATNQYTRRRIEVRDKLQGKHFAIMLDETRDVA